MLLRLFLTLVAINEMVAGAANLEDYSDDELWNLLTKTVAPNVEKDDEALDDYFELDLFGDDDVSESTSKVNLAITPTTVPSRLFTSTSATTKTMPTTKTTSKPTIASTTTPPPRRTTRATTKTMPTTKTTSKPAVVSTTTSRPQRTTRATTKTTSKPTIVPTTTPPPQRKTRATTEIITTRKATSRPTASTTTPLPRRTTTATTKTLPTTKTTSKSTIVPTTTSRPRRTTRATTKRRVENRRTTQRQLITMLSTKKYNAFEFSREGLLSEKVTKPPPTHKTTHATLDSSKKYNIVTESHFRYDVVVPFARWTTEPPKYVKVDNRPKPSPKLPPVVVQDGTLICFSHFNSTTNGIYLKDCFIPSTGFKFQPMVANVYPRPVLIGPRWKNPPFQAPHPPNRNRQDLPVTTKPEIPHHGATLAPHRKFAIEDDPPSLPMEPQLFVKPELRQQIPIEGLRRFQPIGNVYMGRRLEQVAIGKRSFPGSFEPDFSGHSNSRRVRSAPNDDDDEAGVSLAFVFDTTGSMQEELNSVKEYAIIIMTTMLNNPNSAIYDFIFVPIHDESPPNPPTVTRDKTVMLNAINSVTVGGGLDCPEKSLTGVKKAVELSRPGSFIFVFTDAHPTDFHLTASILDLLQLKHHTVYFLLTGSCWGPYPKEQTLAFSHIARATSGMSITLNSKSDVNKILDNISLYVIKKKVVLSSVHVDGPAKTPYSIPIPLDSSLGNLTVGYTGLNTKVNFTDPTGKAPPPGQVKHVIDIDRYHVDRVDDPMPGVWTLEVTSDSAHDVVATGVSTTDFVFGFSVIPTHKIVESSHRPMKGARNSLLLQAKDPSKLYNVTDVTLKSMSQTVLLRLLMDEVDPDEGVFIGGPFTPPNELFKLEICGFTKEGHQFKRITVASISPKDPDAPYISFKKEIHAAAGVPFNMTCRVESLVPMTVKIYKNGRASYAPAMNFQQTSEAEFRFPNLKRTDEGRYTCWASNVAGASTSETILKVSILPPVVTTERELTAVPGQSLMIPCTVRSFTSARITWTRSYAPRDNYELGNRGVELLKSVDNESEDPNLVLPSVSVEDEGWYICTATNEGGEATKETYLNVREAPKIAPIPDVNFQINTRVELLCRIEKGVPGPRVYWRRNGSPIESERNIHVESGYNFTRLVIFKAARNDEGTYECVATNKVGSDIKGVKVKLTVPPIVRAARRNLEILVGQRLVLQCSASGIPPPQITWSKIHGAIAPHERSSNGYFIIERAEESDGGDYKCVGVNDAGRSEDKVKVLVGFKPQISLRPKDTAVELGASTSLFCQANGLPDPVIGWRRRDRKAIRGEKWTSNLEIKNATLEDAGSYVCYAENVFGRDSAEASLTVTGAVPPTLVKPDTPETIKQLFGQSIEIPCQVQQSNPPPLVSWFRNGVKINPTYFSGIVAANGSLLISLFNSRFVGNYTCQVENQVGVDSKTVQVQPYDPPRIDINLNTSVVAVKGGDVELSCNVSGDPPPTISWSRDSRGYPSKFRGVKQGETSLLIKDVIWEDSGKYICTATNLAGITRKEFTLEVLIPPKIENWPSETFTELGNLVSLTCNATGFPKPQINWLKNNETMRRSRFVYGQYLRFFAEATDAGTYSCVAENKVGTARMDTNLIILERPEIMDLPQVIEAIKGRQANLICYASGNPQPTISWLFNGEIITKFIGSDPTVLHIDTVSESDAGLYFCVASNKVGTDRRRIQLKVLEPPQITSKTEVYKAAPGEMVQMECKTIASPKPSFTWYKDGEEFVTESSLIADDGTLQFLTSKNDSGTYTCVATNKAGSDTKGIILIVLEPPTFALNSPKSVDAILGTAVDLPCIAFGDPPPEITWDQYNFPVFSNKLKFFPENGTLRISNVSLTDGGTYICKAKNKAGVSYHSVELNVLEMPRVQISSKGREGKEMVFNKNEELVLDCSVGGSPKPEMIWLKDGLRISNSTKISLTTSINDSGNYTCLAKNSVGYHSETVSVLITAAPTLLQPENEVLTPVEGDEVKMSCEVVGVPEPVLAWMYDDREIGPSDKYNISERSLVIEDVTVSYSGVYTCRASNTIGTAEKLFNMTVHALPKILTDHTAEITIERLGQDYSIPCVASGVPKPNIEWKVGSELLPIGYKNDHYIVYTEGSLILANVTTGMSGEVECYATNMHGRAAKSYRIEVLEPVGLEELIRGSQLIEVEEVSVATFRCPSEKGSHILWLKNGNPVKDLALERADDAHYYEKEGGLVLKISDATPSDSGSYTCVDLSNGNVTTDFELSVLVKPYFSDFDPESEFNAVLGQQISVDCTAAGNPEPIINWKFVDDTLGPIPLTENIMTGIKFTGASGQILQIPFASLNHNGNYSCVARNKVGRSPTRKFTIRVTGPPQLDGPVLEDVHVPLGGKLRLKCRIGGAPPPSFSWSVNASDSLSPLEYSTNEVIKGNLKKMDEGLYNCTGTNAAGSVSQLFDVKVIEPPVITVDSNTDLIFSTSDPIELHCTTSTTVPSDVFWLKNGFHVKPSANLYIGSLGLKDGKQDHVLKIFNATKESTGVYVCVVSNMAGNAEHMYKVSVLVPPALTQNVVLNVEHELGVPLALKCPIESETEFQIIWTKNNLTISGEYPTDSESLYIFDPQFDDEGLYGCTVMNKVGQLTSLTKLSILAPPSFLPNATAKELIVARGTRLVINCVVSGRPDPDVDWTKDLVPITNGTDPRVTMSGKQLEIEHVGDEDAGDYSCLTRNKVGEAEKHFAVTVLAKPNGTEAEVQNVTVELGGILELVCPTTTRNPNVTWFKGNIAIENTTENVKIITELKELLIRQITVEDSGIYFCNESTALGTTAYYFSVTVVVRLRLSEWSEWSNCSKLCNGGVQNRSRECSSSGDVDSFIVYDKSQCDDLTEERRQCNTQPCPVDGGWSEWVDWQPCSVTCGGGVRIRVRNCDSPVPKHGGMDCIGVAEEVESCNTEMCPIDGNWSEWTSWSSCSSTCGFGVKMRVRKCNNPKPSENGAPCSGPARDTNSCYDKPCRDVGKWSQWRDWSPCSVTCGRGYKTRSRSCLSGKCTGVNNEARRCREKPCSARKRVPRAARINVRGHVNGRTLNDESISTTFYRNGTITGKTTNFLKNESGWFPYLHILVTPVSWSAAQELDSAKNGLSLTQGKFNQTANYQFSSGEALSFESRSLGVERNGVIRLEMVVNGSTPIIEPTATISVLPYSEIIIPRENELLASSSSVLDVDGRPLTYHWNRTLHLDNLPTDAVEEMKTQEITVSFNREDNTIDYRASSSISLRLADGVCPLGFNLSRKYDHCIDVNECQVESPCHPNQTCVNILGSFKCECEPFSRWNETAKDCLYIGYLVEPSLPTPIENAVDLHCGPGFTLIDGFCQDYNECSTGPCSIEQMCLNTLGSYTCVDMFCPEGFQFRRAHNSSFCLMNCEETTNCVEGALKTESLVTIYLEVTGGFEPYDELTRIQLPNTRKPENTVFSINVDDPNFELRVKIEGDYIVLYSLSNFKVKKIKRISIYAAEYDGRKKMNTCQFIIFMYNIKNFQP